MVKRLLLLSLVAFALGAQAQYQLQNNSFENWEAVSQKFSYLGTKTRSGNEPVSWNSFISGRGASGLLLNYACNDQVSQSSDVRDGVTGSSAYLISKSVAGGIAIAQGNLTTGCINMGSMSADDANGNYNFTNESDAGQCMKFTGRPDQMKVWIKSKTSKTIKIAAYLHVKGYFQDPTEGNASVEKAALVASATATPESNKGVWTQYTLNFNYESGYEDAGDPAYALVSFATCSTPGGGAASDVMWIDDVEMVYNSELESAVYDGRTITFTNGAADLTNSKTLYDESKLVLKSNGHGAKIEKDYNATTGILTITVTANDNSASHLYTIAFYVPSVVDTKEYTDDLLVTINGNTNDPLQATVTVEYLDNGNINFSLRNFVMWMFDEETQRLEPLPIGNINISNLSLIDADEYATFSFNGNVVMAAGDDGYQLDHYGETIELGEYDWSGPIMLGTITLDLSGKLSDNALYVTININLMSTLGQIVGVQFGYDLKPYTLSSEYGTICIPTAAALPDGVKAYSCASVTNNVLDLEGVSSLAANTPYILEKTGAEASYTILSTEKTSNEIYTTGCLNGVLTATSAPTDSYVLQNLDNNVAFYQVSSTDPITVPANRCYLTTTANVKALAFPDGTLTSISEIQAADEKAVIYDLSGRRVSKATKGIYIINGKKVIK